MSPKDPIPVSATSSWHDRKEGEGQKNGADERLRPTKVVRVQGGETVPDGHRTKAAPEWLTNGKSSIRNMVVNRTERVASGAWYATRPSGNVERSG